MEFLRYMRSLPAECRRTGPRAVARAMAGALKEEGGQGVSIRLDRTHSSAQVVDKPVDDSYWLFQADATVAGAGKRHPMTNGNTPTQLLLRFVIIPAPGADREHGPLVVVAQPVPQWEWLSWDKLEDPSLWVLSPSALRATATTTGEQSGGAPLAVTVLDIQSAALNALTTDLSGPDDVICAAFERLRQQLREQILRCFSQCATAAPQPQQSLNCEPGCEDTILVARPPFPSDADISRHTP